jgi:predicted ATPase/phosphoribosyl 1,2-cyclic phosphodiesterase/anti-anti-sigma regulatory factor
MKIKIWGARGSIPSPLTSQALREKMVAVLEGARGVDLYDPMAIRAYLDRLHPLVVGTAGGNTSCVQILADTPPEQGTREQIIILDAGTGIRALGQELMSGPCGRGEGAIHLFFSHTHWDHIQGFPFFLPAYVPGNQIYIYGLHPVQVALVDQMKAATFPISMAELRSTIEFMPLNEGQSFTLGNIQVANMRLHHPGDAYTYRFEHEGASFVYATDVECKKLDEEHMQPFLQFFAEADALIFDSQFTLRESLVKADWGHSSALIGAEIARQARVKRLILFHHDPTTTDSELIKILADTRAYQTTYELEPSTEILIGCDGLTIDLTPSQPFNLRPISTPKTIVLQVTQDFDQQSVGEVVTQLSDSQEGRRLPKLIVDLSEVKQLTIAGLRSLIDLREAWKGRPMALAAVSPQAREIIELASCLDLFAIYSSVETAQDALEAQEALRLPGQLIKDRYRIEGKIRDSDIGTIFKATDTRLDRMVALLVLSPTLSEKTTQRLLQQAQKFARLQSPNIITLFDSDKERGLAYLVMEYSSGQTLRGLLSQNIYPPIFQVAIGISQALEYAHSKGAVHGNLRPSNILIGDEVKLTDFGLGLLEEGRHLIDTPILISTPHYLAPEQIEGQPIDARADLYALGVILYELATKQRPFEGDGLEVLEQHLSQTPRPPRQLIPHLSPSFEHLILKLLAKDPDQRYETAAQVHQVLSNLNLDLPEYPQSGVIEEPVVQDRGKSEEEAQHGPVAELIAQRRGKLIGREGEMEQILRLWSLAEGGRGQLLLIGGEAGIGKTRLSEEIKVKIGHGIALVGRCSEFEGNPPHQPFVEIGRHYLRQTSPEALRRQLGDRVTSINLAAALAPLIPDLYEVIPNLTPLPRLEPEQELSRLRNSLVAFVARSAAERPWLMILDDLHWSDPSSLQLLHHLARHLADLPLLIMGTYRDVELDLEHPLRDLMSTLSRSPIYHHLSLKRLNKDHMRQMLEDMWQQEVPPEWVTAIYDRTDGNPFYIKEVAKTLAEEGVISFADGAWHFAPVVELKLPSKIRDIVLRRVNRVSPETQEILSLAAVLGQQFNFPDLVAVSNRSEEQVLASLDEALAHNLIREVNAEVTLSFSNVEIQQVIYENLSKLRRSRLHQQAGEALARLHGEDIVPVAGQLAYHFLRANDREQAFIYSLKAGQHAQACYAYQTALRWYTQAESLLPRKVAYTADHVALYQGLGDMFQTQARFAEAIKAYQTMATAAEAISDPVAQVQALYLSSSTQNLEGDYEAALKTARQTEKAARASKSQNILARALYEEGWALLNLGETEAALAVGEQLLTFSSTLDATYEVGQSLNLLAAVHRALGNYEQAIDYQQQSLILYRQLGDRNRVTVMLNNLAENYRLQGDYQSAISLYQEALSIAREIGDRVREVLCLSNLGGARVGLGDYAAAEADLMKVIVMPETVRSANLSETHRYLAEARLGQGKLAEALAEAQLALALGEANKVPEAVGLAWRTLAYVAAEIDDPVTFDDHTYTPADCFEEGLRVFTEMNMAGERIRTLQTWADYEESRGETETAAKLRREAATIQAELDKQGEVHKPGPKLAGSP